LEKKIKAGKIFLGNEKTVRKGGKNLGEEEARRKGTVYQMRGKGQADYWVATLLSTNESLKHRKWKIQKHWRGNCPLKESSEVVVGSSLDKINNFIRPGRKRTKGMGELFLIGGIGLGGGEPFSRLDWRKREGYHRPRVIFFFFV